MRTIGLLESERHRTGERTAAGTAASLTLHLALIALAILATTHHVTSAVPESVFVPLAQMRATTVTLTHVATPPAPKPVPHRTLVAPAATPTTIAPPSNSPVLPVATADAAADANANATAVPGPNDAYSESDVDETAGVLNGQRGPVYPEGLQRMGVEGKVLARFIVGTNGRVDGEATILSSSNDAF